jgi:hypothetical protein
MMQPAGLTMTPTQIAADDYERRRQEINFTFVDS